MAHANVEDTLRLDSDDVTFDDVRHWITTFAMPFMAGHSASTSRCTHCQSLTISQCPMIAAFRRLMHLLHIFHYTIAHKRGIVKMAFLSELFTCLRNAMIKTTDHHKISPPKNSNLRFTLPHVFSKSVWLSWNYFLEIIIHLKLLLGSN